jgi:hypothetical protein
VCDWLGAAEEVEELLGHTHADGGAERQGDSDLKAAVSEIDRLKNAAV